MEPKVVIVPDPHLTEGPTKVQDMLRAAQTQPRAAPQDSSGPPPEQSKAMVQRHPRSVPEPVREHYGPALAPRLVLTRPSGALPPHVHQALDHYEADLAYVEEVVLEAGLTASRLYLDTDQMTTSTLDISYRRREGIGFADALEKERWLLERRRYHYTMSEIHELGARAVGNLLSNALDNLPEPPRTSSKLVAFLRDGSWR